MWQFLCTFASTCIWHTLATNKRGKATKQHTSGNSKLACHNNYHIKFYAIFLYAFVTTNVTMPVTLLPTRLALLLFAVHRLCWFDGFVIDVIDIVVALFGAAVVPFGINHINICSIYIYTYYWWYFQSCCWWCKRSQSAHSYYCYDLVVYPDMTSDFFNYIRDIAYLCSRFTSTLT